MHSKLSAIGISAMHWMRDTESDSHRNENNDNWRERPKSGIEIMHEPKWRNYILKNPKWPKNARKKSKIYLFFCCVLTKINSPRISINTHTLSTLLFIRKSFYIQYCCCHRKQHNFSYKNLSKKLHKNWVSHTQECYTFNWTLRIQYYYNIWILMKWDI